MNVVSLCAGVGGIDLGLERAGMTTVAQVELDPFCRSILDQRWPEVPKHDDVRSFLDWWGAEPRPAVDLIAAGFPCTDIAPCGRRAGLEGEHSGLWFDIARIVRSVQPRFVLLENSTSLLVRGLDRVLADLAGCGFDAEWDCVPAAAVDAPHLRAREWVLAYPRGFRDEAGDTVFAGRPIVGVHGGWPAEPAVGRVADGLPDQVVRPQLKALGNSVCVPAVEHIGRRVMAAHRMAVAA